MFGQFMKMNTTSSLGSRTLSGNRITNPKEDLKGITTRRGTAYPGPTILTTSSSPVVERETEATKDKTHPTNNRSTKDVQPSVVPTESPILTSEPVISPIIEPVACPVSAPRPNQRPLIPYPSRLQDQKLRDKANDQREKFFQIFKDLNFNMSFADALILMPKFGPSIKSLLTNKDKLCELARTPLNKHCSAVLLKKLPEKLGDPGKFLIPYDFPKMVECLALADLGASINLMPLSVWNKLYLPDLSPTCMTLELADRSISRPVGVVKDVFVKVGAFHFLADFVVVDFDADHRVPLIHGRSFLETGRALIDVFEGELTLHVGKQAITFNLNQTSRYSANYNDMTANRIDVIDMAFLGLAQYTVYQKGGFTVVENEENELILTRLVMGWRVCIDYRKLNEATHKDHFPLPFVDQMLERLAGNQYYYFLDGFSGYFQILIDLKDQETTMFTCPYRTFAYLRMPFGLSNVPVMSQRCMTAIFHDMIEKTMKVFMDDLSVFRNSFQTCLSHLEKMLKSIVCTDHSALKYLFDKKDSKVRLLHWVLLLQEFTFKVIDTKEAKNLAADHLSRLENPHQNVLDPKEINESFPLETLNLVSTRGDSSTSWFADFTNYHTGNFVVKGMSSQQKRKFFKDVKHYFWDDPFLFKTSTPYQPQTSGQVEVSNRSLKRILEMTVGENHASWSDKLDDAL
nr:reverse transcriptase domain-containing protein [Tanacetum cinerariifolium]